MKCVNSERAMVLKTLERPWNSTPGHVVPPPPHLGAASCRREHKTMASCQNPHLERRNTPPLAPPPFTMASCQNPPFRSENCPGRGVEAPDFFDPMCLYYT